MNETKYEIHPTAMQANAHKGKFHVCLTFGNLIESEDIARFFGTRKACAEWIAQRQAENAAQDAALAAMAAQEVA